MTTIEDIARAIDADAFTPRALTGGAADAAWMMRRTMATQAATRIADAGLIPTTAAPGELVPPMDGLTYQTVETMTAEYGADESRFFTDTLEDAHVITSRSQHQPLRAVTGNVTEAYAAAVAQHKIVLDIDMPAVLVPSSTPGHHHLYIDKTVTWTAYQALLDALETVGLLEPGYVKAAKRRGFTAVRLPWVRKPEVQPRRVDGSQVLPEHMEDF